MRHIRLGGRGTTTALTLAMLSTTAGQAAAEVLEIEFEPTDFTPGTLITNRYWPLIPGTGFVYFAESDDACAVEHKYYCPEGGGLMLIEELQGKTVIVELIGDSLPAGNFAIRGVCPE